MHTIFSLDGTDFVLMEGPGEHGYAFSPAFSLIVNCETQKEVDEFWTKLTLDGETSQCGWLTDKYGVSWQITPAEMDELMDDSEKSEKVMKALLQMKKIDIAKLKEAAKS